MPCSTQEWQRARSTRSACVARSQRIGVFEQRRCRSRPSSDRSFATRAARGKTPKWSKYSSSEKSRRSNAPLAATSQRGCERSGPPSTRTRWRGRPHRAPVDAEPPQARTPRSSWGACYPEFAMCRYAFRGPYRDHYACFTCRKSFKWPHDRTVDPRTLPAPVCPDCHSALEAMGLDFRAPPKDDLRQWRKVQILALRGICLLYTSPSPRDRTRSRMPSSA